MSDWDMKAKYAGREKFAKPGEVGRNTHTVWVTLGTVNNGKKKTVAGTLGTQSTLMLLPVNGTSADENALTWGATSRTATSLSSNVIKASALTGSNIFMAQTKSFPGSRNFPWNIISFMDGEVHLEALNVAVTDNIAES
jgi:hypothetical protein